MTKFLAPEEAARRLARDNAAKREWARRNREKVKAARLAWIEANGGKDAEAERLRKWRAANADQMREARRAYKKNNPHAAVLHEAQRRARKRNALPPWFGELDELAMQEAAHLCVIRAQATGVPWHIDHAIPLAARTACGLHCAANLQVIPAALNAWKNNRMALTAPLEWMRADNDSRGAEAA